LEQLARFLERDYESAARRLREGRAEMFTLQRLKLPARRTSNVKYWRDQGMAERWVASAWLLTENRFRNISGHGDLWALATMPGRKTETEIS